MIYLENSEFKNYTVKIYDITGQIIFSKNYENRTFLAEHIDLSGFDSGIYFVKISNGNTSVNKSIVVCN